MMQPMDIDGVKIYNSKIVSQSAIKKIKEEGVGQTGLYCRWDNINRILLKYWRSGSYVIAGNSGTGKSYFIRLLLDDFSLLNNIVDKEGKTIIHSLNTKYKYKDNVKFFHFGYEMRPSDEQIRSLSSLTRTSYSHILQCEYNPTTKDYNILTDKEKDIYFMILDKIIGEQDIYYIPTPLTINAYKKTIMLLHKRFKNHRFVITYDNALLTKADPDKKMGNAMLEMASNLGNTSRDIANKYNDTIIILNQMNSEVQNINRIKYPAKQYPEINDGYGGNALYYAVDNYIFFNKPCSYGLSNYGVNRYKTKVVITHQILEKYNTLFTKNDVGMYLDVIHFYPHKGRFKAGGEDTFLLNALHRGTFIRCPIELLIES